MAGGFRPEVDLESWVRENQWIRGLARSLADDDHQADEAIQDTWIAACRTEFHGKPVNAAWLRTVVRNFIRRYRRSAGRRSRHERAAARPESTGAADSVERIELQQRIGAAVLELREPLRETVILRFFEGLNSTEIARHHGVSAATVRSRIRRALEILRVDLDQTYGGDRRAWSLLALDFARLPDAVALSSGSVLGAVVMKTVVKIAALVVVCFALWHWWDGDSTPIAVDRPPTPATPMAATSEAPKTNGSTSPTEAESTSPTDSWAVLVIDGDDESPIADVRVSVGREGSPGSPGSTTISTAATDDDGIASIPTTHARELANRTLTLSHPEYSILRVRLRDGWPERIRLYRGIELRGRVVDPHGDAVRDAQVRVLTDIASHAAGQMRTISGKPNSRTYDPRHTIRIDVDDAGQFAVRVRGALTAFEARSSAWAPAFSSVIDPTVHEEVVVIQLREPHTLTGRVLDPEGTPLADARIRLVPLPVASPPDRYFHFRDDPTWTTHTNDRGQFSLGALPPFIVGLEVRHAFHRSYFSQDVTPVGDLGNLVLEPAQVIRVQLVDADDNAIDRAPNEVALAPNVESYTFRIPGFRPLQLSWESGPGVHDLGRQVLDRGAAVNVRTVDANGVEIPWVSVTVDAKEAIRFRQAALTGENGEARVHGLIPGESVELRVTKPGWSPERRVVTVDDLEVSAEFVLVEGASVRGRVMNLAGAPIHGATVHTADRSATTTTRPTGQFALEGVAPTSENQAIIQYRGIEKSVALEGLRSGGTIDLGEVAIRTASTIEGKIVDPFGRPVKGAAISTHLGSEVWVETADDGTFRLEFGGDSVVLTVSADGFAKTTVPVELSTALVRLDPVALEESHRHELLVLDPAGQPKHRAYASLFSVHLRQYVSSATAGPDGRITFGHVPTGPLELSVTHPDHRRSKLHYDDRSALPARISLEPGAKIEFVVTMENDDPLPNHINVEVKCGDEGRLQPLILRGSSRATLDTLPPGECSYTISTRGYPKTRGIVELSPGKTVPVAVTIPAPYSPIDVHVVDTDGVGIGHATIQVQDPEVQNRSARTDNDGRHRLTGGLSYTAGLSVEAPGYAPRELALARDVVRDGLLTIVLQREASLVVTVREANGEPASDVTIALGLANWARRRQDANGGVARFGQLVPGETSVQVSRRGIPLAERRLVVRAGVEQSLDITTAEFVTVRGELIVNGQRPGGGMLVAYYWGQRAPLALSQDGTFVATLPRGGPYTLRYDRGELTARVRVEVDPDRTLTLAIDFVPFRGRVVDAEGRGVPNASVRAVGPDRPRARTDRDGRFDLGLVPAGDYSVSIGNRPRGYARASFRHKVTGEPLTVELETGRETLLSVTDAAGNPVEEFSLYRVVDGFEHRIDFGRESWLGPWPAGAQGLVLAKGHAPALFTLDTEIDRATIVLPIAGTVELRLHDGFGTALAHHPFTITALGDQTWPSYLTDRSTESDGTSRLDLPPGDYRLEAQLPSGAVSRTLTVGPRDQVQLTLPL